MGDDEVRLSKALLLKLITEEKEEIASYQRICLRYQSNPDPLVMAVSHERLRLLNNILKGKHLTLQSEMIKSRRPTVR